jgi:CheY-like chemotaxis protein
LPQLGALGQECAQLVKHLLKRKPVLLTVKMAPDVTLLGAPLYLKQILLNLLTNAAKYTPEGEITLSASIETRGAAVSCAPVRVRFAVEDTGVGVPEANRASIFDEFDSSSVKVGTGLGLALCRSLVALMGGQLELSIPSSGRGSIFAFACDLKCQQAISEPAQQQQPIETTAPLPGGLRVLVADDISLNRKLLIRSLMRVLPDQPQIIQAESGEAALEVLLGGWIDIAFLDEHFDANGKLRGSEVAQKVREHEK